MGMAKKKGACKKHCYVHMGAARHSARWWSIKTGDRYVAYKCDVCGWPHLTNRTKSGYRNTRIRKQRKRW